MFLILCPVSPANSPLLSAVLWALASPLYALPWRIPACLCPITCHDCYSLALLPIHICSSTVSWGCQWGNGEGEGEQQDEAFLAWHVFVSTQCWYTWVPLLDVCVPVLGRMGQSPLLLLPPSVGGPWGKACKWHLDLLPAISSIVQTSQDKHLPQFIWNFKNTGCLNRAAFTPPFLALFVAKSRV